MDVKTEVLLDSITQDFCFSVKKQHYILYEGDFKYYLGEPERRAFEPGEWDELREYAPEFEPAAAVLWTPEIVAAWHKKAQGPAAP